MGRWSVGSRRICRRSSVRRLCSTFCFCVGVGIGGCVEFVVQVVVDS